MGEYDDMDYTWAQYQYECGQNSKKQRRQDFSYEGQVSDRNWKRLRKEIDDANAQVLISSGVTSMPEIRLKIGNPNWNPTAKQVELMKLAEEVKAAEHKERQRVEEWLSSRDDFVADDEYPDFEDPRVVQPENVSEFKKIVKKPGRYEVKMNDGLVHEIAVFDRECYADYGAKDQKKRNKQRTRKSAVSVVPASSLIAIDGSNIIGIDDCLRVKVLVAIVKTLKLAEYQCKVFVDKTIFGWLQKKQDDDGLQYLAEGERLGDVIVAPSKTEADGQILQLAEFEKNVHIITNDRFRDYGEMHPWLIERSAGDRLHGVNLVRVNDKVRVLIAGFNLDIVV